MTAKELFEIGLAHERNGEIDQALAAYSRSVGFWPQEIAPYYRLSEISLHNGNGAVALEWAEKGLALDENNIQLLNIHAIMLVRLARFEEAEEGFKRMIAISPGNKEVLNNLARLFVMQERYDETLGLLLQAEELSPNSAAIFMHLGYVLHKLYRYEESIEAYDRVIELEPDYTEAMSLRGEVLFDAHRFSEAEAQYRKALVVYSNLAAEQRAQQAETEANLHFNLAALLLRQGDLANGFEEYEWRWKVKGLTPMRQYPGRPLWKEGGSLMAEEQPLRGETLLVWGEQGFGDTIQFSRFLRELSKQECEIVAEIQPELHSLLTYSFRNDRSYAMPNVRFVRAGESLPRFDMHIPLMSLPRVLGITYRNDRSYEDLPPFEPYLKVLESEIQDWSGRLQAMTSPEDSKKRKIGIVWAGRPTHPSDRDRSMSLETIATLVQANKNRFQFYSLQVGTLGTIVPKGSTELPDVINLGGELTDFAVTAAVVMNLDLVVAVDTSIVHLAGALGKRVWTMLAHSPDWRWRMDKNGIGEKTTPWYPSMSLFWQKKPGVWDDVIDEVNEMLGKI